jgi:ubiquinone biosynthesis protein COQ9
VKREVHKESVQSPLTVIRPFIPCLTALSLVAMRPSGSICGLIRRPVRAPGTVSQRHCYHSEYHPEGRPFPDVQDEILSAAMRHVPTHGFSSKALAQGAKEAGYLEVSLQLLPRGVFDLINYHLVTQRLSLKDRVQFPADSKPRIGQKVRTLTLERLRANKNIIHQWQGVGRSSPPILQSWFV